MSPDPQHPQKKMGMAALICTPVLGGREKQVLGLCWPARITEMAGFKFGERLCLKRWGGGQ